MKKFLAFAALIFMGCIEGPTGPQGERGITKLSFSRVIDLYGKASVPLPSAAGDSLTPPALTCYQVDGEDYFPVQDGTGNLDGPGGATCFLMLDRGHYVARLQNGTPDLTAVFVVVY